MVRMKRAASILLMLMMLVWAVSAQPRQQSADEPQRAVAVLAALPQRETLRDAEPAAAVNAAETQSTSVPESEPQAVPTVQTQAANEAASVPPDFAQEANSYKQMLTLKAIRLPEIRSDAPAPAQIKSLPDSGMMCLTFDDGYSAASIETILGCLREHDVRCTFFVIGACLKLYPQLWQQAVEDGHEIAYHTMSHRALTRCTNAQIVADINEWNHTAASVLGVGCRIPKLARAPGGTTNARVRRLFAAIGYSLIYWSCDTFTGVYRSSHSNAGARTATYILRHAAEGAISLQHFNAYDAASVSQYIGTLKARFRLGTVTEALAAAEMHTQMKALAQAPGQRSPWPYLSEIC